jgi:SWI/SNF-related matrix-associated actin-dependent regulator 1 of chromatin subfamily A
LEIKGIKGTLYEFQRIAIDFLIATNGRGLLALDMGLGKSLVSIAYIHHTKKEKTLVVCPASVKYAWFNEVKKFTNLKPFIVDSKKEFTADDYQNNDIIIVNYDILKKFFSLLSGLRFDCLIGDESTYIKNLQAQRTKLFKKISDKIPSIILLSGTPMLSRPCELFSSLNVLDQKEWSNYYNYVFRYCAAWKSPWGLDVSGCSNSEELHAKISPTMLRMKKEDVMDQLPEKVFIDLPIDLDDEYRKKYNLLETQFATYLRDIKNKTDKEIGRSLQAEKLTKLNELRHLTTESKIKYAEEVINDIVEGGQKVVVFSVYNSPLKYLKEKLKERAVMIIGETGGEERNDAINSFQNDKEVMVFLGGVGSAGTGITLTASSTVVFLDYDWVPAMLAQAYSRVDRIGQKAKSISIYHIVANDTIDQKMQKILAKKTNIFNQVIEGKFEEEKTKKVSLVNDLIDSFK